MSALRTHDSERTEGMGTNRPFAGVADEGPRRPSQGSTGASAVPNSVAPHSASGVAQRRPRPEENGAPRRPADCKHSAVRSHSGEQHRGQQHSGEQSRPSNARAQSFHRYLSAQSDIDEEVLRLYKLVCRV